MLNVQQLLDQARQSAQSGDLSAALTAYRQVLSQYPQEMNLLATCGNLCVQLHLFAEAAEYFRRVFQLNHNSDARNALCYALEQLGNQAHAQQQYQAAADYFAEILQLQPNNAVYWYNHGNALRELGQCEAAIRSFQTAIRLNPQDADFYNNLGNVQRELGQLDLAIASYSQALRINPQLYHALAHWVHQKQHICDWHGLDDAIAQIRSWVMDTPSAQISPFALLAMPGSTPQEQKICASRYVAQHYEPLIAMRSQLGFQFQRQQKQTLRIGYLSADFRLHPLAFLLTEVIGQHDKSLFETYAYSYGIDDKTPARKEWEHAFDHFHDIRDLNDIDTARRIYADNIDILVDLTGYTHSSRTGIVALKPAPTSINWLGYPGTMGAHDGTPLFDYLLADASVAPNPNDICERILYLPCYQPNGQRPIGSETTRAEHHLPEDALVLCCFNQTFKITAPFFHAWLEILTQVPNSVLWLLDCNAWAKSNLQQAAQAAGVDPARLIFAPRVNIAQHVERHRHADLFLDTLPYNAHTTASDALWMDLPVLTCMGDTFAGRVSASLLHQLNLPTLICDSLATYQARAIELATHPEKLAQIKQQLRSQKLESTLFDSKKFAQTLQNCYRKAWDDNLSG